MRSADPEWLPLPQKRRDRRGLAPSSRGSARSSQLSCLPLVPNRSAGKVIRDSSRRPRVHWRLYCWIFRGCSLREFASEFIVGSSAAVLSTTFLSASSGRLRSFAPSSLNIAEQASGRTIVRQAIADEACDEVRALQVHLWRCPLGRNGSSLERRLVHQRAPLTAIPRSMHRTSLSCLLSTSLR